jgi:hypothetical protein
MKNSVLWDVTTDVSKELSASIVSVSIIGEVGTTPPCGWLDKQRRYGQAVGTVKLTPRALRLLRRDPSCGRFQRCH